MEKHVQRFSVAAACSVDGPSWWSDKGKRPLVVHTKCQSVRVTHAGTMYFSVKLFVISLEILKEHNKIPLACSVLIQTAAYLTVPQHCSAVVVFKFSQKMSGYLFFMHSSFGTQ